MFKKFMTGYWNQMASEIYMNLQEALEDFGKTEGEKPCHRLISEIQVLEKTGRFPKLSNIDSAYNDPFWSAFDRILTQDELDSCPMISKRTNLK